MHRGPRNCVLHPGIFGMVYEFLSSLNQNWYHMPFEQKDDGYPGHDRTGVEVHIQYFIFYFVLQLSYYFSFEMYAIGCEQ